MRSRKKNALYLLPRLVGTCTISYQEKREGNKKNRVKTNTFVSILVPYSQPLSKSKHSKKHKTDDYRKNQGNSHNNMFLQPTRSKCTWRNR